MTAVPLQPSPFSLTARVAHGGMATIYAGRRAEDGHEVAIKVLHPHLAEDRHIQRMFLHEAKLASRLSHPNVVRVLDHGEDPEHGTYIVMDYVEGADLSALLKAAGKHGRRLPPTVVARIVVDLCRGLHAAHELTASDGSPLRLIHRDVSPHNLLVGTDGVARLTDFGIAKSDERYTMTRPGQLKGKLAYMAPEQLAHEDGLDRRVDVFAAGVVLWESLLTRRLFKGDDEISIINKVLLAKAPAPSELHLELAPFDPVVAEALAREPEDRFATAEALADALSEAAEALGGLAPAREVAEALEDLLADQLAERAEKIERASLVPSSGSSPIGADGTASGNEEPTRSATHAAPPRRRHATTWILALALFAMAGALGAVLWQQRAPAPGGPGAPTDPAAAPTADRATANPRNAAAPAGDDPHRVVASRPEGDDATAGDDPHRVVVSHPEEQDATDATAGGDPHRAVVSRPEEQDAMEGRGPADRGSPVAPAGDDRPAPRARASAPSEASVRDGRRGGSETRTAPARASADEAPTAGGSEPPSAEALPADDLIPNPYGD